MLGIETTDERAGREALRALGATETTLTEQEKRSLDENGYVVLLGVMDPEWLQTLRAEYERLMTEKYGTWEATVQQSQAGLQSDYWFHEQGTRRLTDLVSESRSFDGIYTHPRLLAAVDRLIGRPFHLKDLNARDALPGQGQQALHSDWGRRDSAERCTAVNSAWLLDDFTPENGSTRVVPGTHRRVETPEQALDDPWAPHPQEVQVLAPAGSVIVFSVHVWHSGTKNNTDRTRRVIHCSTAARDVAQVPSQRERIRKSVYDRLSPAARYILNV